MSFRCDQCNVAQPNETKPNRIVVDTRHKTYVNNGKLSEGFEIVKEVDLCRRCDVSDR